MLTVWNQHEGVVASIHSKTPKQTSGGEASSRARAKRRTLLWRHTAPREASERRSARGRESARRKRARREGRDAKDSRAERASARANGRPSSFRGTRVEGEEKKAFLFRPSPKRNADGSRRGREGARLAWQGERTAPTTSTPRKETEPLFFCLRAVALVA